MSTDGLAEHWSAHFSEPTRALVVPDGCRDLIVRFERGRAPRHSWFDTADAAVEVSLESGSTLHGYRILPGTRFRGAGFARGLAACGFDPGAIEALLRTEAVRSEAIVEAMECFAQGSGRVAAHARALGLSERSLHRLVVAEAGRPPAFWLRLARVRRAARAVVGGGAALADIAADVGYADQAHRSRDVRSWFGCSPRGLGAVPGLAEILAAPAFA